jgi:hypothetical protein
MGAVQPAKLVRDWLEPLPRDDIADHRADQGGQGGRRRVFAGLGDQLTPAGALQAFGDFL